MSTLGSLIVTPDARTEARGIVRPDNYSSDVRALLKILLTSDEPLDAVRLLSEATLAGGDAKKTEDLIVAAVDGVPVRSAWRDYNAVVSRAAAKRRAVEALARIGSVLEHEKPTPEEIAVLRSCVDDLGAETDPASTDARRGPRMLSEIRAEVESLGEVPRLPSAVPGLDALIGGGFLPGWTVIYAAFTGQGKSTLAIREAVHHASAGRPVLVVTLELSPSEVLAKIDAAMEGEAERELPVWIFDESPELHEITRIIEAWIGDYGTSEAVPVVVVDYAQLVRCPEQTAREREVAVCVQTLSRLARQRGFLLVLAAQLNRKSQEDDKPKLHHLRESGQLEQSADVALLLRRPGDEDRLEIAVGKARFGGTGKTLEVECDFRRCRLGKPIPTRTLPERIADAVANGAKTRTEIADRLNVGERSEGFLRAVRAAVGSRLVDEDQTRTPYTYALPGHGIRGTVGGDTSLLPIGERRACIPARIPTSDGIQAGPEGRGEEA